MSNQQNVTSVLFELIDTIQNLSESMYSFLCHIGDREVLNPFKKIDFTALTEYLPAIFFERFGIQRIILNALPLRSSIGNHWFSNCDKKNKSVLNWNSIKNDVNIEDLKAVFRGSDIIQFADWASVYNASNIWDGFLSDVIKPLNKKDFHFIFYLGDVTKRFVFETDEILDVMGEYASYGKVTLMLDECEAAILWSILNGSDPGLVNINYTGEMTAKKYLSIFNTMRIDIMMIFSSNRTTLFSGEQKFEFLGRSFNRVSTSKYVRDRFEAGYQLGLLLHLKTPQCIALGLAISGAYLENESQPDKKALFKYVKAWITELQSKDEAADRKNFYTRLHNRP